MALAALVLAAGCAVREPPAPQAELVLPETLPPDVHPLSREVETMGE